MITADTITDEQIRELRDSNPGERFTITARITPMATTRQDYSMWQLCMDAMRRPDYQKGDARVRAWPIETASARCAEILNARAEMAIDAGGAFDPTTNLIRHKLDGERIRAWGPGTWDLCYGDFS